MCCGGNVGDKIESNHGRSTGSVTAVFAVLCFITIAVFQSLAVLGVGGFFSQRTLPMLGETGVEILTVVVIAIAAYRMRETTNRLTWAIIGIAVLGATCGDILWTKDLLLSGQDMLSSAGFVCYAIEYFAIPLACGIYVYARRDQVDLAWPLVESVAAATLGMTALWFLLIGPTLRQLPSASEAMPEALYALADYPLFVAPTLLVLLTIMRSGRRAVLASWLLFGCGILFVVAADAGWFWQRAMGAWEPGSLVDFAFMGGHVLMATAALSFLYNEQRQVEPAGPPVDAEQVAS